MEQEKTSFWTDIKKYEDALANDPASHCFAPLAELYLKVGMVDDAIAVAEKGIALHPDYVGGHLVLGCAYNDKGQLSQARAALERVLRFTPDNLQAIKQLSNIYLETGENDLAFKTLEALLTVNPGDTESRILLESLERTANRNNVSSSVLEPDLSKSFSDKDEDQSELMAMDDEEEFFEIELVDEVEELEDLDDERQYPSYKDTVVSVEGRPCFADDEETPGSVGITTATLAELYVSQGHRDLAVGIYRNLLAEEPLNERYRTRLELLEQSMKTMDEPVPEEQLLDALVDGETRQAAFDVTPRIISDTPDRVSGNEPASVVDCLQQLLENVRRVKKCRSERC